MSAQHTPGPWLYAQEGVNSFGIVKPDGHSVVHLVALSNSTAARDLEANARLIAAAPELLAALELMLKQFTKTPSTLKDSEARCKAHAAIAKATGSQE